MDNISSQIGALELGDHLESYGDGLLETAATTGPNPTPVCTGNPCHANSDGVLEAAGATVAGPPMEAGVARLARQRATQLQKLAANR